jgi:predicted secreted protein
MKHSSLSQLLFAALVASASYSSHAQSKDASLPTLTLDAQSKAVVANDEMQVAFAFEREGTDLGAMNQAVLQALSSAIADAKKVEGVKARMGSVQTNPNWTPQGKPSGWKVRGEVSFTSQNFTALGNLSGQLSQKLQFSGVSFKLSDEAKTTAERQLIRSAANAFRGKAQEAAVALGFKAFEMKDINLNNAGNTIVRPVQMMRAMRSDSMSASAPVPAEGGESEVIVTFSGTVNLK